MDTHLPQRREEEYLIDAQTEYNRLIAAANEAEWDSDFETADRCHAQANHIWLNYLMQGQLKIPLF